LTLDDPLRACLADVLLPDSPKTPTRLIALPSASAMRAVLPVDDASAAARIVRRQFEGGSWKRRVQTTVLSALVSTGIVWHLRHWRVNGFPIPRERSFRAWIAGELSQDHRVGLALIGPQRANRKPVVLITDVRGRLIAVAKLGYNEVTRPLVRHEASALVTVATALGSVAHVPELMASTDLHGTEALLMRALPEIDVRADVPRTTLITLVRAISSAGSSARSELLDETTHPRMTPLVPVATRLRSLDVPFGASHGDLHSGNLGVAIDGHPAIWDWERWSQGVPLGFDLLHFDFQNWVTVGDEPKSAARRLIRTAEGILSPLGIPSELASDVARDYLIRLAARYVRDAQDEAGSRLGAVEEWLFPAVLDGFDDKEER